MTSTIARARLAHLSTLLAAATLVAASLTISTATPARAEEPAAPATDTPAGDATPSAPAATGSAGAEGEATAPFLWRVESPAGTSWLFGTMHLGIGADELPSSVHEAFGAASTLYLEADMRTIDPMAMLEMAQLPEGTTLPELLGPEIWARLRAQLGLPFPEEMLARLQPWVVETMLSAMVIPTLQPMDMQLLSRAQSAGKTLTFLEDWRDQLAIMNRVPLDMAVEDLTRWFNERDVLVAELLGLLESYRQGDLAAVEALVLDPDEMARHAELYRLTLFERNANWMPAVTSGVDTGGAFIAVGLAHLLGEQGLVERLRALGYPVERVGQQ